jgi:hypothetical protein
MSESAIPKENELLFQTWIQIKEFMNMVKKTYKSYGYEDENELNKIVVEWGNRIFHNPDQVNDIINTDWPAQVKKLKQEHVLKETARILESVGAPPQEALQHAREYVDRLRQLEDKTLWSSNVDIENQIRRLQKNLNVLAYEYMLRSSGSALKEPLSFPTTFSTKEVYDYVVDQALRGSIFPFVAYMASTKGGVTVTSPGLTMDPVKYKQALEGDRDKIKILWSRIFKVVGVAALTTLIVKGLLHLYKKYKARKIKEQDKDRYILIRVESSPPYSSQQLDKIWSDIKNVLQLSVTRKYTKKRSTTRRITTEMLIKYSKQPSRENVKEVRKQLEKKLDLKESNFELDLKDDIPVIVIKLK